jgi:hypothetical protein
MTNDFEPFFPDLIADHTAAAISEFLLTLTADFDAHYLPQLRRHYARKHVFEDSDPPCFPPPLPPLE